jgi:hypothetical protein
VLGTKAIGMGVLVMTGAGRASARQHPAAPARRARADHRDKARRPLAARVPVLRRRLA